MDGEEVIADCGREVSGWVCCILTVALGSAGRVAPSGGSVIRAVSFFGAAALVTPGSAPAGIDGAGVGFRGTVGRAPSDGGFGGVVPGVMGFAGGAPMPDGGRGGQGGGGATGLEPVVGSLLVSFFGAVPSGATGFPGTLMRTVSRFTAGVSPFGGSVMRIVSFLFGSSFGSEVSSAIEFQVVSGCISPVEKRVKPFPCHCRQMRAGTFSCSHFSSARSVRE